MKLKDFVNITTFEYHWDVIETINGFASLKGCEQNPRWHAEGDAWEHTKLVCMEAVKICKERQWEHEPTWAGLLLGAALFHDIGKSATTKLGKDGNWHSYGHENVGEHITRLVLWDEDIAIRETICGLVKWHMEVLHILDHHDYLERIINISNSLNGYFSILCELKRCDINGSMQYPDGCWKDLWKIQEIEGIAQSLGCRYNRPHIPERNKIECINTDKEKGRVVMMVGVSGSGKSTAINEENIGTSDYVVASRDLIRAELGFCKYGDKVVLDNEEEKKVTEVENSRIVEAIKNGKVVVIDNMNLKRKYRDSYHHLLRDYNITWDYIYVQASSIDKNVERRKNFNSNQDHTYALIVGMITNLDWPTSDECNSLKIITT